jgi:transposase InsO family protein
LPQVLQQYIVGLARLCPHLGARRLADAVTACTRYPVSPMQVWRLLHRHQADLAARAAAARAPKEWTRFSGLAPHALWQMDILYAYPVEVPPGQRPWGYLIAALDDYSRAVLGARLGREQTTLAVLATLAEAIEQFGCPRQVVVDNGKPFHAADFVAFCQGLGIEIRYCGKHHPQSKGNIERWFRTCRKESMRVTAFVSLEHNQRRREQQKLRSYLHSLPPSPSPSRKGRGVSPAVSAAKKA